MNKSPAPSRGPPTLVEKARVPVRRLPANRPHLFQTLREVNAHEITSLPFSSLTSLPIATHAHCHGLLPLK